MLPKLILSLLLLIAVSAGFVYYCESKYPFVLASEAARTSLMVSEAQLTELNQATMQSDMIVFAVVGAAFSAILALVLSKPAKSIQRIMGAFFGLVAGAILGALGGWIGHQFLNPALGEMEISIYQCLRMLGIMIPIGIAASLAVGVGGQMKTDFGKALVGAILGIVAAALAYSVLSGLVTTVENRHKVFPHHMPNRLLMLTGTAIAVAVGMAIQLYRKAKTNSESQTNEPTSSNER